MHRSSLSRPRVDVDTIIDTLWGSFQLHGPNSGVVLGPYEAILGGKIQLHRYKSDIPLEPMIEHLCSASRDIFLDEPCLLRLQPPITIAGNCYGEFSKLKAILEQNGPPPLSKYLFLGNYVDLQGLFLHTILLLLAFKIKYPGKVFLLKGNSDHGGFSPQIIVDEVDSVMRSVNDSSLSVLKDCLKLMPVAALISDKIICTNSGISPRLHSLDQIRPHSPVLDDLIGTHLGPRGRVPVAKEAKFLKKNDLRLVCCGDHQVVSKYKDFSEHRVVFVSSAASGWKKIYETGWAASDDDNDDGPSDNTVMRVDVSLKCSYYNLLHKEMLWSYQIGKASTAQDVCSSAVDPPSRKVACSEPEASLPSKFKFDPTSVFRRNSPEVKKGKVSTTQDVCSSRVDPSIEKIGGSNTETTVPSKVQFDPTNLYRSKSPGVKRFLGARV